MVSSVTLEIDGGSTISVPWTQGLTARQALEAAWQEVADGDSFTYGLQYYGSSLGYLVFMINETYDTFLSVSEPFFYWEFSINGNPAPSGVDETVLNAGDVVGFALQAYEPAKHEGSLLAAKHQFQLKALAATR